MTLNKEGYIELNNDLPLFRSGWEKRQTLEKI